MEKPILKEIYGMKGQDMSYRGVGQILEVVDEFKKLMAWQAHRIEELEGELDMCESCLEKAIG